MTASNTRECWIEQINKTVVGVLFDSFGSQSELTGSKALVMNDGTALVVTQSGSYWIEDKAEVTKAIERKRKELEQTYQELGLVLKLAGDDDEG